MASEHLPHPRPCVWGWGQQDPGPPASPGVLAAWQLCPRVPRPPPSSALLPSGLGSTLTTSCPSWCLYSSAAGTALPLQMPQPSPPAATGQTEPSHPTRWCPSQDPAPCPHNGPPSMQRTTPRPPAPTLPLCDSRNQPLPLTTRETGRRAQPPASRPPGPEAEPSRGCLLPRSCWRGWGLPDPTAGRTLPSAPEAHPGQG